MKDRFNKAARRYFFWAMAVLMVAILCAMILPAGVAGSGGFIQPHRFWGRVLDANGNPVSGATVTAWMDGALASTPSMTTNTTGWFGAGPPTPNWLLVNNTIGGSADLIVFRVNNIPVRITSVGTLVSESDWAWQQEDPALQAIQFQADNNTGVELKQQPTADTTPPAAITNLFVKEATSTQVRLTWTAPGDDGSNGTAIYYDIRYNTTGTITADNWSTATPVDRTQDTVPVPQAAGANETFPKTDLTPGLSPGTTYYFAVRAYDEASNPSNVSNCVSVRTADNIASLNSNQFWGHVYTAGGYPAASKRVTAWNGSQLSDMLATDSQGNLGSDPLAGAGDLLTGNGDAGSQISFKVDGLPANITRIRTDPGEPPTSGNWVDQTPPATSFTLTSKDDPGSHKFGIYLVYNPPDTTPPAVTVTSPNGGEKLKIGSSYSINWTATDDVGVTSVDIAYSIDNGAHFNNIVLGQSNTGSYPWTVPNAKSANCLVKITARDAAGHSNMDISDAVFKIYLPGDANNDGQVTSADVTSLESMIMGKTTPYPDADANEDGRINVLDITIIEGR